MRTFPRVWLLFGLTIAVGAMLFLGALATQPLTAQLRPTGTGPLTIKNPSLKPSPLKAPLPTLCPTDSGCWAPADDDVSAWIDEDKNHVRHVHLGKGITAEQLILRLVDQQQERDVQCTADKRQILKEWSDSLEAIKRALKNQKFTPRPQYDPRETLVAAGSMAGSLRIK